MGNKMNSKSATWLIMGNLALVQCQAIVVGFLASLTAVVMGGVRGSFGTSHFLLLCASSVITASVVSFVLGLVMVTVILVSQFCGINPDNVATPFAASLGDITTLALLSCTASFLYDDLAPDTWFAPLVIGLYIILALVCAWFAYRCQETRPVLYTGWSPVVAGMMISSGGGFILSSAVAKFHGIAIFQPFMNGAGGNLVAVQASRMSTYLHRHFFGTGPDKLDATDPVCVHPCQIIFGECEHARIARTLLMFVFPLHTLFVFIISYLKVDHPTPSPTFIFFFLLAALLQVVMLLCVCRVLVFGLWKRGIDPDNSAIPYLTALGDLLGGLLLCLAFELLHYLGEQEFIGVKHL